MKTYGPPQTGENLFSFLFKYKFQFWVSSLAGIAYNTIIVLGPILLGRLMDRAVEPSVFNVWISGFFFVGVTVFFQLARFIKRWFMRDQFNHVACDLRQTLLERIVGRKLPELEKEKVGDLISRTVGDVTLVVDTVMSTLNEFWDTWLLMISYFLVLLYMDWKITLLASLLVPITLMLAHMMRQPLYQYSLSARETASTANTGLHRYLSAISVLRSFGKEDAEKEDILKAYEEQVKWNIRQALLQQSLLPIYGLIAGIGVVIAIAMGAENVRHGLWSVGTFNAYLVMFVAFSGRTRVAAKVFNRWHGAKAAWKRVKEKILICKEEDVKPTIHLNPESINHLKVSKMNFSYGEKKILEDISFEAKAGEIIGITGPVGSGKSTLLNVLLGQYPFEGDIELNGISLRDLTPEVLNPLVGYSGHEQFLFSMTLEENIVLGEQPNKTVLDKVLDISALSEDFSNFEDGLNTHVGEGGRRVSGGQRQRIAMARAFYKKPRILLLDDPFSALDMVTEAKIIHQLRTQFNHEIIIISSHRLSLFEEVDKILLLEKGRILESGSHKTLMCQGGLYSDIYLAQKFMKEGTSHES